jgi:phosphatidylglycerol:prolipoprotein diacylglycerol transferase
MLIHNINPTLVSFGPFEIRYYGLIFAAGFILAALILYWLASKNKIKNFDKKDVFNFILYLIIGVLIFSRLFEILIYEPAYYFSNPAEMFALWHGGLSFHGGLVGAIIVGLLYSKYKKVKFYDLGDILVLPAAIGLCFGRFANFINGELWGKITDLPWCVQFKGAEGCRHPTQIYESFKNLAIFFILLFLRRFRLKPGFLFWHFILLYGVIRFSIEFLKPVGWYFISLNTGQWLCLIMIITAVTFIIKEKYYILK